MFSVSFDKDVQKMLSFLTTVPTSFSRGSAPFLIALNLEDPIVTTSTKKYPEEIPLSLSLLLQTQCGSQFLQSQEDLMIFVQDWLRQDTNQGLGLSSVFLAVKKRQC